MTLYTTCGNIYCFDNSRTTT